MVGSQDNDDQSYDPTLGEFFDIDGCSAEFSARLGSAPDTEPPVLEVPSQTTRLPPREGQEYSTDAANESLGIQAPLTEDYFDFLGGSPQAATETGNEPLLQFDPPLGNSSSMTEIQDRWPKLPEGLSQNVDTEHEPLHQHRQPSRTDYSIAGLQNIDDELEEVELRLRHKELRRERQRIIQNMLLLHQAQSSHFLGSREDRTSCNPGVSTIDQTGSFPNTSEDPIQASQPTESARASSYRVEQSQDGTTNSPTGLMDISYTDIDNQYSVIPLTPSYLNSLALPNSAPEVLSHQEVVQQSGIPSKETSDPNVSDTIDLPNNEFAGAYGSEIIDHLGVPTSMPNPLSGQSSTFPAFPGSLHGEFPDRARLDSASSALLHHHQPNQTTVMSKISTRKRRRSVQGISERGTSATQKRSSKQSSVPETHLHMWCSGPAPRSSRTISQKQNKKAVEKAGGACFYCLVLKKQCSGQRPCDRCKNYWQERVLGSTSFMWTCDVRSKLSDFSIFKHPLGNTLPPELYNAWANTVLESISDAEIREDTNTQLANSSTLFNKFGYLFDLIDRLEPFRYRGLLNVFNMDLRKPSHSPITTIITAMYLYSYAGSVVRSKESLLSIAPRLKCDIISIERLYRESCLKIFKFCDTAHGSAQIILATLILWLVYDELRVAETSKELDPSLAAHLQSVVSVRLDVYSTCTSDRSRRITLLRGLLSLVKSIPSLDLGRPVLQVHQGTPAKLLSELRVRVQPTPEAESLRFSSCLLSRSDVTGRQPLVKPTNCCCCGWFFNSIPSGIIRFFGHSSDSFAHLLHANEWSNSSTRKIEAVEAEALVGTLFGHPSMEISRLQKRIMVFREAFCISFQHTFNWMIPEITASKTMLTENQIKSADTLRQQLFSDVLVMAVLNYDEFRKSRGKDWFDVHSVDKLMSGFLTWRYKKFNIRKDVQ